MSKITEPYRCDSCGKLRETDANRWWLLGTTKNETTGCLELVLFAWNQAQAAMPGIRHTCGEDCAQKLIARWMQTDGSFDAPSARPISKTDFSVPTGEEGSSE